MRQDDPAVIDEVANRLAELDELMMEETKGVNMSGYCDDCGNTLCICNWERLPDENEARDGKIKELQSLLASKDAEIKLLKAQAHFIEKEVSYLVRKDGLYVCYLKDEGTGITGPEEWIWDESYRTREEFERVYNGHVQTHIFDNDED